MRKYLLTAAAFTFVVGSLAGITWWAQSCDLSLEGFFLGYSICAVFILVGSAFADHALVAWKRHLDRRTPKCLR